MEKVFEWISHKASGSGDVTNPFQDMVIEASRTLDQEQIKNCALQYNSYYLNLPPKELLEQPIKKECIVMLSFMIPLYEKLTILNEDTEQLFTCIKSSSIFTPAKTDYSELYYHFVNTLITNQVKNNDLSNSKDLLKNLLKNNPFVSYLTRDENLTNIFIKQPQNPIIFQFLREAVLLSSISSPKNYQITISSILNIIDVSIPESLYFISAFYKKIGKCSQFETIFDSINRKVNELNNIFFYEDVLKVSTNAPFLQQQKFSNLVEIANPELIIQILAFVQMHLDYGECLLPMIGKLKNMQKSEQNLFLQLLSQQKDMKLKNNCVEKLMKPWLCHIDCQLFSVFIAKYVSSETCGYYLLKILIEYDRDAVCDSFEHVPDFQLFIMSLINSIDEFHEVEIYFNCLVQIINNNHPCALTSLQCLCLHFPPVTYKDLLLASLDDLNKYDEFSVFLYNILHESVELRNELLVKEFVEWLIKHKKLDSLAALAVDGPHKLIDECITALYDENLKSLDEIQLQRMAYGLRQNAESDENGSIVIPSILPKLTKPQFSSLFDRFVSGKYLFDNNYIDINSPILPEIGVQYLSHEIASKLIENTSLLMKITNPIYPHQNVIQFQANRDDSFMIIASSEVSFSFRVDKAQKSFVLFSIHNFDFVYNSETKCLCCNGNSILCEEHTWHEVTLCFSDENILDIHVNKKRSFYLQTTDEKRTNLVIGSTKENPGSTFYIKDKLYTSQNEQISYQKGSGLLRIEYRGIAYHAPLINLVPRLLKRLLEESNKECFEEIFISLLNIESFESVSVSVNDFLGFLRVILCERSEMLTESIILACLDFVVKKENSEINWSKFRRLFIDYKLWKSCLSKLTPITNYLLGYFNETGKITDDDFDSASLLHFLIDLVVFCDINDDNIINCIITICKTQINYSSLTIHIFNKEKTEFINKLINGIPNLLSSIPFKYIPQMPPEIAKRYFYEVSLVSSHNEQTFEQIDIEKMTPILSKFVSDQQFWVSLFILLTKVKHDDIESYSHTLIMRQQILHSIFSFISELYQSSQKSSTPNEQMSLLNIVVQTVKTMIEVNNLKLKPYLTDLQVLLYYGIQNNDKSDFPVLFQLFEPLRMPVVDNEVSSQKIEEDDIVYVPYKQPDIKEFLMSPDLWFGLSSRPFIDVLNEEIPKLLEEYDRNVEREEEEREISRKTREIDSLINSEGHKTIVELTAKCLTELSEDELYNGLNETTIFNSNVESQISLILHREVILAFLNMKPVSSETLRFLRKMVVAGWWESDLSGLFNAVMKSFSKYIGFVDDKQYLPRLENLIKLTQAIFSLAVDFSKFQIVENAEFLFSINNILENEQYLLFIIHIMTNENFTRLQNISDIWHMFINPFGTLNNVKLTRMFGSVFSSDEDICEQISGLANRTDFFRNISDRDQPIAMQLKDITTIAFDTFLQVMNEELDRYNKEIKEERNSLQNSVIRKDGEMVQKKIIESVQKTEICFSKIEIFSFQQRFNIISHQNERSSYHLWSILPDTKNSSKYQLSTTVHPLSTPILYVPLSSKIPLEAENDQSNTDYVSKIFDYCNFEKHKKTTKISDTLEIVNSFTPPTLCSFGSMPFFESNQTLVDYLFRVSFKHYGSVKYFSKLTIIYGTNRVKCALAVAERGFYIITEAKCTDKRTLELKENRSNLSTATFLDSLTYKYYGSCSLFFGHCVLFLSAKHVVNSVPRNYCHAPVAIELWFHRGYSLFLVFKTRSTRDTFYSLMNHREHFPLSNSFFGPTFSNNICKLLLSFDREKEKAQILKKLSEKWILGEYSSQTYLTCLNFLADRSFSNHCQYPVFPWSLTARDMSKPIGQQNADRAVQFQNTFDTSAPDIHFYGSHYSSAAVVMHFLMRIEPFSNLFFELHNGFDHPDRLFSDIEEEWLSCSHFSSHNVEELVPEFFLLPECLIDTNNIPFPKMTDGKEQNDVTLPPGYNNPVHFVWSSRKMLDDNTRLEKWIDLIFGCNSRGNNAVKHKNLFYPTTYGRVASLVDDKKACEQMMRCFGQTPSQLFTEEHPPRNTVCFKRKTLLIDTDKIFTQFIHTKTRSASNPIVLQNKGVFEIDDCASHFSVISHSTKIPFSDGLMTWNMFTVDDLVTSCFSIEKLLFCGVFETGAMQICRAICKEDGTIVGYYPLSSCAPPPQNKLDLSENHKYTCCSISSHHFVACEACSNMMFCFHVGTGLFIRCIETREDIMSIQIDDSFSCFYIFCTSSIEVFTINGTFVGRKECDSPIITSSISCNDVSVFAATAHKDGTVRFWTADPENQTVKCIKTIVSPDKDIISIALLRGGAALVAVSKSNVGVLFVSRGAGKGIISKESAVMCASCSKMNCKLHECQSCGLYYCDSCCTPTQDTICNQCLGQIEECNDFDF